MVDYALTNTTMIRRVSDDVYFPPDPDNERYQEYAAWLAAGGVPDPYEPPPAPVP